MWGGIARMWKRVKRLWVGRRRVVKSFEHSHVGSCVVSPDLLLNKRVLEPPPCLSQELL